MRLLTLYRGAQYEICAIDRSRNPTTSRCPAEEFLQGLDEANRRSMTARIEHLADQGPTRNPQHTRPLGGGVFELKTRQGARLIYYYDSSVRRRIIVTHGFLKPSKAGPEKSKALALRDEFERAQAGDRQAGGRG
jgi:phage-related protein